MDNRPIGIFDSGLGGLTTVKKIVNTMPHENIIYFGDTGRVPYGTRDDETIIKYSKQDVNFLNSFNIKIIVIACGTVSSVALSHLLEIYSTDIIGIVEPSVACALKLSKNKRIGILGTLSTIKTKKYSNLIRQQAKNVTVVSVACPMFVPLVENGYAKGEIAKLLAKDYLKPLKTANVDTVILGCTHYPLLEEVILNELNAKVFIVDSGACAAEYVKILLQNKNMLNDQTHCGKVDYYVSDNVECFAKLGGFFLGEEIAEKVKKIDIEVY